MKRQHAVPKKLEYDSQLMSQTCIHIWQLSQNEMTVNQHS